MNISTKDAMGKMFFTMMSAFAELEANLLSERTKKGLASARARGRKGGRPLYQIIRNEKLSSYMTNKNLQEKKLQKNKC